MKLRLLTILILSLGCCTTNKIVLQDPHIGIKETNTKPLLGSYYIKSISLIDSTYILKVSRNDSMFKIVSPLTEPLFLPPWLKKERPPCERLLLGKLYELEIHSIFEMPSKIKNPDTLSAFTSFGQHRGAILINGSTVSFDQESNYDIYYARNLRGICYLHPDSLLVK